MRLVASIAMLPSRNQEVPSHKSLIQVAFEFTPVYAVCHLFK